MVNTRHAILSLGNFILCAIITDNYFCLLRQVKTFFGYTLNKSRMTNGFLIAICIVIVIVLILIPLIVSYIEQKNKKN